MTRSWSVNGEGVRAERGVSDKYGVRDAACPISTRGGGGRGAGDLDAEEDVEGAPLLCVGHKLELGVVKLRGGRE